MNRKTWCKLIIPALLSALVFLFVPENQGSILLLGSLPFSLLGNGLRALSLSGEGGNAAAIVIYVLVCLLPLVPLLRKNRSRTDWVLALGSPVLFYVLYLMINPGLLPAGMGSDVGKMILSGTVYSVFLTWGALRLLHWGQGRSDGYRALRVLLAACAAVYIVAGFGVGAGELKAQILAVRSGNTMPGQNLTVTYGFLTALFAVQALEFFLDASLMLRGIGLARCLEQDPYSECSVAASDVLSKAAQGALTVILLSNMGLNIAQVLAASRLYHIDASVRIPVFSTALCFGCMVLTRLLSRGKEIKEENDLYI